MKNLHIIPTNDPSKLIKNNLGYGIVSDAWKQFDIDLIQAQFQNIYITSSEEIKGGDWVFDIFKNACPVIRQLKTEEEVLGVQKTEFKIILTDNKDLIKDGVQAIDDEFLEWFVKNPSCEEVEVKWVKTPDGIFYHKDNVPYGYYKVIIPQEESKLTNTINKDELGIPKGSLTELIGVNKQETLEGLISEYHSIAYEKLVKGLTEQETTADYIDRHIVEAMVEVAKQKMYSEEEVIEILNEFSIACYSPIEKFEIPEWFEKYKKK